MRWLCPHPTEHGMSCIASCAFLLQPHVIIQFRPIEVRNPRVVVFMIDNNGPTNVDHKEILTDDSISLKFISKTGTFKMYWMLLALKWIDFFTNSTTLFTYLFIQKWTSSVRMIFQLKLGSLANCLRVHSVNSFCDLLHKFDRCIFKKMAVINCQSSAVPVERPYMIYGKTETGK